MSITVGGATQLISCGSFLYFELSSPLYPQRSAESRQLAIDQQRNFPWNFSQMSNLTQGMYAFAQTTPLCYSCYNLISLGFKKFFFLPCHFEKNPISFLTFGTFSEKETCC